MDKKRKFRIWLIAFGSVLLVFLLYNFLVDAPEIRVDSSGDAGDDIRVPKFEDQDSDTRVGRVDTARFRVLDEETKELRRVFGFETLLNPGQSGGRWQMLKPYMYIYDDKFSCEIISDKGDVEVETVAGKYRPTDAKLYDNVVIRIIPKKQGQPGSTIYLDSLVYNGERSEYSTDGPIKVISQDGVLEGTGMLLIYNNELARVEFLKITDLDYIRLTDASKLDPKGDEEDVAKSETSEDAVKPVAVKPVSDAPTKQASTSDASETVDVAQSPSKFYKCNLNKDVAIRYGDELIVTSQREIVISDILWSSKSKKSKNKDVSGKTETVESDVVEPEVKVVNGDVTLQTETAMPVQAEPESNGGVEVLVKCGGGLVIRPMDSFITPEQSGDLMASTTFGDDLHEILDKYDDVDWGVDNVESPPALFGAKDINYNLQTGGAVANAPVELTLYSRQDNDSEPVPSIITANENAEFFADADRKVNKIVFSGDVVGSQEVLTPLYRQKSSFFGQKLVVDLADGGGSGIRHISVDEGKVKLEMQRFAGGTSINHVRLSCNRIDYDVNSEMITSVGPGKIEINNENAPASGDDKDSKLSLKKPCFALVEGFDRLKWMPQDKRITADGKEKSVNMAYLPIVDGKRGQVVRSSVTHMQADFVETVMGRSELAMLNAWGGVYYKEQAGNELIGDKLVYDVAKSMMVVTGTENRPCLANGALVPRIEYNLENGRIRTKLSSSPGVISMPRKKKK